MKDKKNEGRLRMGETILKAVWNGSLRKKDEERDTR
jgi:hypothetical protein